MPSKTGGSTGGVAHVQKWVDSIQAEQNGAEPADTMAPSPVTNPDGSAKEKLVGSSAENDDELSLGAEARLLPGSTEDSSEAAAELHSRGLGVRWSDDVLRRQHFTSLNQASFASFASESSRHSYDQLVCDHRIDPEQVLLNLGFMKRSQSDTPRVPDHFLLYPSKATGITCDGYLEKNPEVRQRLEQKLALQDTFQAAGQAPPSPGPGDADTPQTKVMAVSRLFSDERVPLRYLESVMRRIRTGRRPDEPALAFDGYGHEWSWRLDSASSSSYWLSTDMNSLSIVDESVPTDNWSMQPTTAGDWSTRCPDDSRWYSTDFNHVVPALHHPLSGLLPTSDGWLLDYPEISSEYLGEFYLDKFYTRGQVDSDNASPADSASESWHHQETVDFFIDDTADAIAGCGPTMGVKAFHERLAGHSDEDEFKKNIPWNKFLSTVIDLHETLV